MTEGCDSPKTRPIMSLSRHAEEMNPIRLKVLLTVTLFWRTSIWPPIGKALHLWITRFYDGLLHKSYKKIPIFIFELSSLCTNILQALTNRLQNKNIQKSNGKSLFRADFDFGPYIVPWRRKIRKFFIRSFTSPILIFELLFWRNLV